MPLMVTAVWSITVLGFWKLKGNTMSRTSSLHKRFSTLQTGPNNTVLLCPCASGFCLFDVSPKSPKIRNKKVSGTFP